MLTFYPSRIQDTGVKKAPDPESGTATLLEVKSWIRIWIGIKVSARLDRGHGLSIPAIRPPGPKEAKASIPSILYFY
jgi:hypothetical protein